jgi:nucleoside-diphosphate-sugar epimerase
MPAPVGEYSQSCLGRERIFQYCARQYGTKSLLFRLNYSNDLRYGVLHDIARSVWEKRPVNNTVGFFNVIWQGDATAYALRSLELASAPCSVLNVTGPETASVEKTALMFGQLMNKKVQFSGETGNRCYLNNSAKMCALFGYPSVTIDQLIRWQAEWLINGGESINIPTHFEVNNGKF